MAVIVAVVVCCQIVGGCSKKERAVEKIEKTFSAGDYDETVVLCEHALRSDIRDAQVYFYYGLALLEKGRDFEAIKRFGEAVAVDSTLGSEAAQRLLEAGRTAVDANQGRLRLKAAVSFDAAVDLGPYSFRVADAFFADKDFEAALGLYQTALDGHPDTTAAEEAYFNVAECHLALADSAAAIESLEQLLDRFPRGQLSSRAGWKLASLIYEDARAEFARGNYEKVIERITGLLEWETNRTLIQRARFLLGEAYERIEDYPRAYEQYKAIIQEDRGASGRIVDRARAKIDAFRDSGLL